MLILSKLDNIPNTHLPYLLVLKLHVLNFITEAVHTNNIFWVDLFNFELSALINLFSNNSRILMASSAAKSDLSKAVATDLLMLFQQNTNVFIILLYFIIL